MPNLAPNRAKLRSTLQLAGSNEHPRKTEITTARTTNTVELIASRTGDALFGYFLALGQKVTRRLRRRNSHARQARQAAGIARMP
ncbi:hypothetical protein QO239_23655 [Cupriavidus taiwanensis]|uniref:hypothetical protein n=1 Tax=Cupriavidus taiwanensis TaxID=164546 RepID=UPI00253F775D|nr:hypothetical protein [Cupriavidus taiwanensis]MDK3025595.1 hypothetical protein [Cupriavidus taiwanensis]